MQRVQPVSGWVGVEDVNSPFGGHPLAGSEHVLSGMNLLSSSSTTSTWCPGVCEEESGMVAMVAMASQVWVGVSCRLPARIPPAFGDGLYGPCDSWFWPVSGW